MVDCPKQIYYVVHRLPSIIRVTIHLKVHKHPMVDGKCKEFVDYKVDRTPDAKISMILLGVNKTFTMHLFDDSDNGIGSF